MTAAVRMRTDYSASELRRLAATTKNANQIRRLLSLAAVLDGMNRADAARIGGMDQQTLRDWVHRFAAYGPEGLTDTWSKGSPPRLSPEQLRAVLHHQGGRQRHRPGPLSGQRVRPPVQRPCADLQRTRRGHHDQDLPAPAPRRGARPRRGATCVSGHDAG